MRTLMSLVLFALVAPTAFAGGMHARIEGPGPDGVTYTARTYSFDENDTFEPWALAEGVVDGRRRSVLIRVKPTGEQGVYQFTRSWPAEGEWMIRYMLGHPPGPATVVRLRPDGSVRSNKLHHFSDGSRECGKALRKSVKPSGEAKLSGKDDC